MQSSQRQISNIHIMNNFIRGGLAAPYVLFKIIFLKGVSVLKRNMLLAVTAVLSTLYFAGCSDSVETGIVPSITPRPAGTEEVILTPTPEITQAPVEEDVYTSKRFKEYYEASGELPQLYRAYENVFQIGLDVLQTDITDEKRQALVKQQFNCISCKKDLSPMFLMNYEASRASGDLTRISLDFSGADIILKFAMDHDLPVRGPALITYESPAWAFTKDFDETQVTTVKDENGKETTTIEFASKEIIKLRMENYIKDVIVYCNTNYPGVVISWDVLEGVIFSDEMHELKYRTSSIWHQALGNEYVMLAAEYGRKYADANQKMFLAQDALEKSADLNATVAEIERLKEKDLIDGVAIQAHYKPSTPNVFSLDNILKKLHETGLELHITEFFADSNEGSDSLDDYSEEELRLRVAKRYKNLMTTFVNSKKNKAYNIVNITFEGLTDDTSSLNEAKDYVDVVTGEIIHGVKRESYPYLFNADLTAKDSLFAAMNDATIKGY